MNHRIQMTPRNQPGRFFSVLAVLLVMGPAIFGVACGDDEDSSTGNDDEAQENQNDDNDNNDANGDDDNDEYGDPPEDPDELCEAACARIYDDEDDGGCDTLFTNEDGGAVIENTCVSWCLDDQKFRGGEWCVVTEAECTENPREMIEECLPDDYHPEPCADLGIWEFEWIEREDDALELLNDKRSEGAECGGEEYPAVDPVEVDEFLRCAARLHSDEMRQTQNLSAENEAGENTQQRIENVGFEAESTAGVVNHGGFSGQHIIGTWFGEDSDHCDTVMGADFTHVGIGNTEGGNTWWTLKMAESAQ